MSIEITPDKVEPLPFRVKKFDYNRYYIKHLQIKGILNLANVVNHVGKIPDSLIPPPDQIPSGEIAVGLGFQAIVSFTNQGEKHSPTNIPTPQDTNKAKKIELTNYIIEEQNYEPWNEYVLADSSLPR